MKTIGLIGGMSWESTTSYYQQINTLVSQKLGGLHSAKINLHSVDFAEVAPLQQSGDWDKLGCMLSDTAQKLEQGGADFVLICTNTMHLVAPQVQAAINIPLLHIADATAQTLEEAGINKVGLLGTRYTMEQDFYKGRLIENYDLEVLIPEDDDRTLVHNIIFDELCLGKIEPDSHRHYLRIINQLRQQGAQGIILGCTEIALLVKQQDTDSPLFDTVAIHAAKAVEFALENKEQA